MSDARSEILTRVRAALAGSPSAALEPREAAYASLPRAYNRHGELSSEDRLHLFRDRLLDYDAEILEVVDEAGIAAAVTSAMHSAQEGHLLVAAAFPQSWLPADIEIVRDTQLSIAELDTVKTVATTCEAAVASTGTIFLVHEGAQGRRALTLLPDHHICIVQRSQVYELLPEAMQAIASKASLPLTTISGPSATSDIEMTRIRGVHGPRRLTVVLYG